MQNESPVSAKTAGHSTDETLQTIQTAPIRILVAENHPSTHLVFDARFQYVGHRCDAANSGDEVLVRLTQKRYDLIILNRYLIGTPITDVIQHIRQYHTEHRLDCPLIAISLNEHSRDSLEKEEIPPICRGDIEYLKPITRKNIQMLIDKTRAHLASFDSGH